MVSRLPDHVRQLLKQRADERCERCGERYANNAHHRKNKSQGGEDVLSNLLLLCGSGTTLCHGYITEHPTDACNNGWSVKPWHDPADIPVKYRDQFVFLDDSGFFKPVQDVI